jgi:deoxyhypusine synthase
LLIANAVLLVVRKELSELFILRDNCNYQHCAVLLQNNIPVYSPALTDGSLGDMIYFHSYKQPGLVIDIVEG